MVPLPFICHTKINLFFSGFVIHFPGVVHKVYIYARPIGFCMTEVQGVFLKLIRMTPVEKKTVDEAVRVGLATSGNDAVLMGIRSLQPRIEKEKKVKANERTGSQNED